MTKTLGNKIRDLRNALGLTQNELAEKLGISLKSIQRYEKGQSKPDSFALSKIATFFDVSADYLLGTCGYKEQMKISKERESNQFYKQYIKCRNEYVIDKDAIYYWIYANEDEMGGQTEFAGWVGEPGGKERRVLRAVIPEEAIELCASIYGKPMVLNEQEDVIAFIIYGGQAIIKKDVCEKYMPWYLKEFISW